MGRQSNLPASGASRHSGRFSWQFFAALPRLLRQASGGWFDDNAQRLGASLAFYTLLSLAPVIVIAVAVAAVVYGHAAAEGRLALEIRGMAGPDVAQTIQELLVRAYQPRTGAIATVLGLAALAFGSSSVFVELHDAMNTIWHVPGALYRGRAATVGRLLRERFFSFLAVLSIGFLLLLSLVLNAAIKATGISVAPAASFVTLTLVVAVLFAALYKILPDVSLQWSDVGLAATTTALLFTFGKQLIGIYFAAAGFGSAYAAAGSPIVVLLWVYYSAQLFFWGAEFSKVYTKTVGSQSERL